MKYFIYIIIAIVVAAVIFGFFVVGFPKEERLRRADDQRISSLQIVQGQIIYYWQNKEKLPAKLDDLKDPLSGFAAPKDPETGENYGYTAKGALNFELCANFNLPSRDKGAPYVELPTYPPQYIPSGDANWEHAAGQVCFERTIDPELYKPVQRLK